MKYFERLKIAANVVDVLKKYGIYAVLLVLVIFFAVTSENFFQSSNLLNVARQVSMLGIASVGFAFVLLLGGIDLSIGSVVTLVNVVTAWLMCTTPMNPILPSILVVIMSAAIGFANGWIIANIRMPPLIVTLAMMIIIEGVAYMICKGLPIYGFPKSFAVLGQGYVGPIPIPVIIMAIILGIGSFILNKTYFGRYF